MVERLSSRRSASQYNYTAFIDHCRRSSVPRIDGSTRRNERISARFMIDRMHSSSLTWYRRYWKFGGFLENTKKRKTNSWYIVKTRYRLLRFDITRIFQDRSMIIDKIKFLSTTTVNFLGARNRKRRKARVSSEGHKRVHVPSRIMRKSRTRNATFDRRRSHVLTYLLAL